MLANRTSEAVELLDDALRCGIIPTSITWSILVRQYSTVRLFKPQWHVYYKDSFCFTLAVGYITSSSPIILSES